eukprot:s1565_g15.t2
MEQEKKQASGSQLAERLEQLLAELQGSAPRAAADSVSAAEHAMRSMHLDPLVEDIAKKFTAAASTVPLQNGSPKAADDSNAVEEALKEFDDRSAWLVAAGSGLSPCQPLLQAVRQRLAARLEGVLEAVARGRRESAMMLRAARLNQTPSKLSRSLRSEDMRTPTPPHTPSRRWTLSGLLGGVESTMLRVEAWHSKSQEDIRELENGLKDLTKVFSQLPEVGDNAELGQKQEIWQKRLQDFQGRHRQQLKSWQTVGQEMLEDLVPELQKIEVKMPDVVSATVMLEEARAELESLRLLRQKALESSAAQRLEQTLEELKNRCAEEIGGQGMRAALPRRRRCAVGAMPMELVSRIGNASWDASIGREKAARLQLRKACRPLPRDRHFPEVAAPETSDLREDKERWQRWQRHATLQERVSSRMASRLAALGEFLDQEVQQRRERHQALVEAHLIPWLCPD